MSEKYALTSLIWPINQPVSLSAKYGYRLENPTADEALWLRDFLEKNIEAKLSLEVDDPKYGILTRISFVDYIMNNEKGFLDKEKFKGEKSDPLDIIASNWVIVRIEDEIVANDLYEDYDFRRLRSYISILDFLSGRFFAFSGNIVFEEIGFRLPSSIDYPLGYLTTIFHHFGMGLSWKFQDKEPDFDESEINIPYLYLDIIKEYADLIEISSLTDDARSMELLGDIIHSCFNLNINYYHKIMIMASIIEFIVARNPDASRFNVEDSINKQFRLKASLIINRMEPNLKLDEVSEFLKLVYDLRSAVAHGSFDRIDKIVKSTATMKWR